MTLKVIITRPYRAYMAGRADGRAHVFTEYRALGGLALDIAERRPEPPTGRTTRATGIGLLTRDGALRAEGAKGCAEEGSRSDQYGYGDCSCR
ncbi:hypothetical protein CTZ27_04215 [Streptomyces griseocarneus]|nr:hypothetical protein CTZ27_04215 [Streptomyces griseocarneus]